MLFKMPHITIIAGEQSEVWVIWCQTFAYH